MKKIAILSLAAVLGISGTLFAQAPKAEHFGPPPFEQGGPHQIGPEWLNKLDQNNKDKVKAIHQKFMKQIANKKLDLESKSIEIKRLLLADALDQSKIESAIKEAAVLEADLKILMLKQHLEIKNLLGDKFDLPPMMLINLFENHRNGKIKGGPDRLPPMMP